MIGIILLGVFLTPVFAQNGQQVIIRVMPKEAQVMLGDTVDMAVEVANVTDLYAIDILVEYDPQAVEVVDMNEELPGIQVQIGTFLEPGFTILNLVDNQMGRLRLAMTQLNPASPKSGTGLLVVIRFKGKAISPQTDVKVINVQLATPFGTEIAVNEIEQGKLAVVQTIVGPTATEIPAQDPGTPMPTQAPPTAAPTATGTLVAMPSPTATTSFLIIPPTPTITPTPTLTPLPTATPNATFTSIAAVVVENTQQTGEVEPVENEGGEVTVVATKAPEEDRTGSSTLLWVLIPIGVLLVGGGIYLFSRKKADRGPQEY